MKGHKLKKRPKKETIQIMKRLLKKGIKSSEAISKKLGTINPITTYQYASSANIKINMPKDYWIYNKAAMKKYSVKKAKELSKLVDEILNDGSVTSLEDLCIRLETTPRTLFRFGLHKHKLISNLTPYKTNPNIDNLADLGFSQTKIAIKNNCTIENVRQHLLATLQYKTWEKKRQEVKDKEKLLLYQEKALLKTERLEKNQAIKNLLLVLKYRLLKLGEEKGFAYEKAAEYIYKTPTNQNSNSFNSLVAAFKRYEKAKKSGKKIGLEKIVYGLNISFTQMGNILNKLNLEPIYGKKHRHTTPKGKKAAIQRSFLLNWYYSDIGYFLDLPDYIVQHNLIGTKQKRNRPIKKGRRLLTKRLESEIYEAKDLTKLKNKEIILALDINKALFDYVIEYRNKIEPEIIKGLKIIYGNPNIENSYRDLSKLQ
nr:hypothetical protein [Candidatus Woesearchaeota archaeon]